MYDISIYKKTKLTKILRLIEIIFSIIDFVLFCFYIQNKLQIRNMGTDKIITKTFIINF